MIMDTCREWNKIKFEVQFDIQRTLLVKMESFKNYGGDNDDSDNKDEDNDDEDLHADVFDNNDDDCHM